MKRKATRGDAFQKENCPCKKPRMSVRKRETNLTVIEKYRKENCFRNSKKLHEYQIKLKTEGKKQEPKENNMLRENNKEKIAKSRAKMRRPFGIRRRKLKPKNGKSNEPKPEKNKEELTKKEQSSQIRPSCYKIYGLKECMVHVEKLKPAPIMAEEPKFEDESARVKYMLLEVEKMLDDWIPKKQ